jgi:hypothetical protein
MSLNVVDMLEIIEIDVEQRDIGLFLPASANCRVEQVRKRMAIGKTCQGVKLGEVAYPFGFAVPFRYIAEHDAILKVVSALPS